mgnify:CR=1 FL=1
MAKPIVVSLDGIESSFDHIKLDRKRLYGERRRVQDQALAGQIGRAHV